MKTFQRTVCLCIINVCEENTLSLTRDASNIVMLHSELLETVAYLKLWSQKKRVKKVSTTFYEILHPSNMRISQSCCKNVKNFLKMITLRLSNFSKYDKRRFWNQKQ